MPERTAIYRIADMAESERPRERLAESGAEALTVAELLAILLRTGLPGENAVQLAHRLLEHFRGLPGLYRATFQEVCDQRGLGPAKAAQIKAALELGNRMAREISTIRPAVHSPSDAVDLLKYEMSALDQETLKVLLLDTRNRLMEIAEVYRGSLNSSQVRVGELFKLAIRRNAASIIIAHNHPSGDPAPSPDDLALTRAVVQAGHLLDIEVLDHLVIGAGRYVSLKERGLGFDGAGGGRGA